MRLLCTADQPSHAGAGPDEGARLQRVDPLQLLGGGPPGVTGHIEHLATYHPRRASRTGQLPDEGRGQLGVLDAPQGLEGHGQQRVPRQQGHGLAEHHVIGGLAPPELVIVHTGQVIVDQRVGVNHFHSGGGAKALLPPHGALTAHYPRGKEQQERPEALAPGEDAVPHRLVDPTWRALRRREVRIKGRVNPL